MNDLAVNSLVKYLDKRGAKPLFDWVLDNIYMKSKRFSFAGHKYLEAIYKDNHPYDVYLKAAQVGISTKVLLRALWISEQRATKSIYYFPTDTDVKDFSDDRVKPLIEDSPLLREKVKGVDNVGLKQMGASTLYFRGMFTKRAVKSVDADYIIKDELDEASPENQAFANDRVMHSDLQWVTELSQPSIPGYGIDLSFEESDQRYFLLKCPHCGHYNNVVEQFPDCMMVSGKKDKKYYLGCFKCHKELDGQIGEYVPKFPHRTAKRGYQLSQLYTSIIPQGFSSPIEKFYKEWHRAKKVYQKKRIMISVVGLPYAGDNQPITENSIKPALGKHNMLDKHSFSYMGIDVGDTLHAVVGHIAGNGKLVIHMIKEITDWKELDRMMFQHGVMLCIIDAMPYKNSAKDFARRFPGRVYIQYFKGDTLKTGFEGEDELAVPKVTTDRTESLDETTEMIRDGELIFPDRSQYEIVELAITHCKMLIKDLVENNSGTKKFVYKKNVENHLGMAINSLRIAREISTHEICGTGVLPAGGNFYG